MGLDKTPVVVLTVHKGYIETHATKDLGELHHGVYMALRRVWYTNNVRLLSLRRGHFWSELWNIRNFMFSNNKPQHTTTIRMMCVKGKVHGKLCSVLWLPSFNLIYRKKLTS